MGWVGWRESLKARNTSGATGVQHKSIPTCRVCAALSGAPRVRLWPRGLPTSEGQALHGPRGCSLHSSRRTRVLISAGRAWFSRRPSSPKYTSSNVKRRPRGIFLPLDVSPFLLRLTSLPPSACSCLKTSLGALLLTSSSSPAHPLFIPQPAFTFDKETVQSLFSPPLLACCNYGDL